MKSVRIHYREKFDEQYTFELQDNVNYTLDVTMRKF